jgi:hypothetical protein
MTNGPSIQVLSLENNPDTGSGDARYIFSGEIFSFSAQNIQRPSNFLFQIARGSGGILSECPFSLKKHTSVKDFFRKDHFKVSL